jgi:MOZ/SAS family
VGNEIYHNRDVCVYEVDGSVESTYCRGLILLMAIFSNNSSVASVDSLACDVVAQASLFYVLMKNVRDKCHVMGFFSKVTLENELIV